MSELDSLEQKIQDALKNTPRLTKPEKRLFWGQYVLTIILFSISQVSNIMHHSLTKLGLGDEESFELKIASFLESITNLPNYLESSRGRLVTDLDKISALGMEQSFFKRFVKLFVEMGDAKEALVAAEKSKTRAFVDLLATPANIQADIQQIFAKEKVLLNMATTPMLTFEDIIEMLQK